MDNSILEQQALSLDALVNTLAIKVADIVCQRLKEEMRKGDDRQMTRQEVMDYLHVTDATLWRWGKLGLLVPTGKVGTRVYYKRSDVDKALENSKKH